MGRRVFPNCGTSVKPRPLLQPPKPRNRDAMTFATFLGWGPPRLKKRHAGGRRARDSTISNTVKAYFRAFLYLVVNAFTRSPTATARYRIPAGRARTAASITFGCPAISASSPARFASTNRVRMIRRSGRPTTPGYGQTCKDEEKGLRVRRGYRSAAMSAPQPIALFPAITPHSPDETAILSALFPILVDRL
jgi:hypothetical protein